MDAQPHESAAPRCILIGTATELRSLAAQLQLVPEAASPVGAVLVGGPDAPSGPGSPQISDIGGVEVLGTLDALERILAGAPVEFGVVSMPMSMPGAIFEVRRRLRALGLPERFVPPLTDLLAPPDEAGATRHEPRPSPPGRAASGPDFASLLDRQPHTTDRERVRAALAGRRVLVTGAGGSIGSELARLVAGFDPGELILVERSENALFEIDRQLARLHPQVSRRAVLHDVVDQRETRARFGMLRPDVVFHTAAHKHVPLMEDHPVDAVRNNVFGTVSVAEAAIEAGAERFVLISSDKAVNPTSVMGATKRLAECCVQSLHERCGREASTRFAVVRFGNVLGSAGSVIPVWSAELAEGGPITVTDPRMTRYFMTINEAATLVIQAAAMVPEAHAAAPLYVLDMGEPVRIVELAKRYVRAHGFEPRLSPEEVAPGEAAPGVMPIVFTGARPGEKLHEQLAYDAEHLSPTDHPGIHAWRGSGAAGERPTLEHILRDLDQAARSRDREAVLGAMRRHVPEMRAGADASQPLRRAG